MKNWLFVLLGFAIGLLASRIWGLPLWLELTIVGLIAVCIYIVQQRLKKASE